MTYNIRKLKDGENSLLDNFLYEALYVPEGAEPFPRDIIKKPELQVYVDDFGMRKGDCCYVAEAEGEVVGAVWSRIMNDYGHIDDETPSLAISLLSAYRHKGIGSVMMQTLLKDLKEQGYRKVSLSVQKENYAVNMYRKLCFENVNETREEYIMLRTL